MFPIAERQPISVAGATVFLVAGATVLEWNRPSR